MTRVPGPWLARLTQWWLRWHEVKGSREKVVNDLHKIYGPVVQISPTKISVNGHGGVRDVYTVNRRLSRPPLLMFHNYGSENLVSTEDGDLHHERRKPLRTVYAARSIESDDVQHAFGEILRDLTGVIDAEVDRGRDINIYVLFRWLGCDIMSYLVYGPKHALGLLRDEKRRVAFQPDFKWIDKRLFNIAAVLMVFLPRLAIWLQWMRLLPKSFDESLPHNSELKKMARDAMQDFRLGSTSHQKAMFPTPFAMLSTHFQTHGASRAIPSENYILSDSLDHFIAGITTTADAFSAALYHLSHPESSRHQERLRKELREAGIQSDKKFTLEQAKSVSYLECIIRETLRLNPPIPVSLERTIPAGECLEVLGKTVPSGMHIGAQAYSMHRHETAFTDPELWQPERWDIPRDSEAYVLMRRHFFAFGAGPRMCLGMNVAMNELRLTLARIYSTYRTSLTPEWFDKKGVVTNIEASRLAMMFSPDPKQMMHFERV